MFGWTYCVDPLSVDGHLGSFSFFLPHLFPNCLRVLKFQGWGVQTAHLADPLGRGSMGSLCGALSWWGAEAGRGQQKEVRIREVRPVVHGL